MEMAAVADAELPPGVNGMAVVEGMGSAAMQNEADAAEIPYEDPGTPLEAETHDAGTPHLPLSHCPDQNALEAAASTKSNF